MLTQIDPEVLKALPGKWATYTPLIITIGMILGRVYQAIVTGGGLKSIMQAIWLGTNVPKKKDPIE